MPTWKEVWEERRLDPANGDTLAQLMVADGLDTGFGSVGEDSWRKHVLRSASRLGITPDSSVFEVGCGAGAYLWELYRQRCEVGGLDASVAQIHHAREVMPRGRWSVAEASDTDPGEPYDFVLASAVFLYFPSLEYSADVLKRMVSKARRGVMILDVPDVARRAQALAYRRGVVGEAEYARRYEGLDHLYIEKLWFEDALRRLGVERISIEDQDIDGYANSAFRYNVFGWL